MRSTYDINLAILESHPKIAHAERTSGITAPWAAAELTYMQEHLPADEANKIFVNRMAAAGVYTDGIEAFNKGTEDMLQRLERRDKFEERVRELSERSRHTPQYSSPDRIRYVAERMQQGRLQQGLSDRFRERDARDAQHETPLLPKNARVEASRDDARDMRAALNAAISSSTNDYFVRLRDEAPNLRDSLSAAFDVHEARSAAADPLLDEDLRSMSNAV